jgi:hypothetical protein
MSGKAFNSYPDWFISVYLYYFVFKLEAQNYQKIT